MTAWLATWLAQGCVAVCAAALLTRALRLNAATRYVAWWLALIAVGSFIWAVSPLTGDICAVTGDCLVQSRTSEPLFYVAAAPQQLVSAFLGVWLSIALVRLLQVVPSLHAVYSLRDRCTAFPSSIESQLPLWLEARAHGRGADLAICDTVQSATVLGFQRPCVAVPSRLVESLTATELDHVILHEYAHVRRRDDWTRLAQTLMQAILWVHPAVALIGRQLDREREMACDEWVVARTGQPKVYARCLARAAEVLVRASSGGATDVARYQLSPALLGGAHDVVRRVDRVLGMRGLVRYQVSTAGAVVVATAIGSGIASVRAVPLVDQLGDVTAPLDAVRTSFVLRPMIARAEAAWADDRPVQRNMRVRTIAQAPLMHEAIETPAEIPSRTAAAEPDETVHALESRVITGAYVEEAAAARLMTQRPWPWSRVGATAVQIGVGAGKAGVNIGGIFSRAGTRAARRF